MNYITKLLKELLYNCRHKKAGFKDQNGKEFREGHFIKKPDEQYIMGYSYIHYNEYTACWGTVAWNHSFTPFYTYCVHDTSDSGGMVCGKVLDLKNYIIIGNIRHNPELRRL